MRKIVLLGLLLLSPPMPTLASGAEECREIPPHLQLARTSTTIEKVEEKSLAEMATDPKRLPQVPLGFANNSWTEFKKQAQLGDELVAYMGGGLGGYLLLRQGCFVAAFNTGVFD